MELDNEVNEQRYSMHRMEQEVSICKGVIANLIAEKDKLEGRLTDQRQSFESEMSRLEKENARLAAELRKAKRTLMKQEETEHQGVDVDDLDSFTLLDPRTDSVSGAFPAATPPKHLRQLTLPESFRSNHESVNRNNSQSSDYQDIDDL